MTREILAALERAKTDLATCRFGPTCESCRFCLRLARRRFVLSVVGYLATALIIVGVVYVLLVLGWAAFGPDPAPIPTDYQLPTI